MPREIDLRRITTERSILKESLEKGTKLETSVAEVQSSQCIKNRISEDRLGVYRSPQARKAVIADIETLSAYQAKGLEVPSFLEAGPRAELRFDPHTVRAAVVTTGGLAPGLHCVLHSIVKRHCQTYRMDQADGRIYGVYNGFKGLCSLANNLVQLETSMTEDWLDQGGSKLGIVRYYHGGKKGDAALAEMAEAITKELQYNGINILYVIGGDGSMRAAHEIAVRNPSRSVIGIPKTMDNDILWIWQTFGFDSAVEQATHVINTLRSEAEGTRRICLVELFGAESGYVAANAALASGHVDAVLIPEVFRALSATDSEAYLKSIITHIKCWVRDRDEKHNPYAVVVVAEGVGTILEKNGVSIMGEKIGKDAFLDQLTKWMSKIIDTHGHAVPVFHNRPRHYIRSARANSHDQIYCERLGALAVDNALAGYSDCMVSQWLTEFVLVPLNLVKLGQKSIPVNGMFWKQVVSTTGQPLSPAEHVVPHDTMQSPAHRKSSRKR
jgi:6-phosphofructokinase 1